MFIRVCVTGIHKRDSFKRVGKTDCRVSRRQKYTFLLIARQVQHINTGRLTTRVFSCVEHAAAVSLVSTRWSRWLLFRAMALENICL